MNKSLGEQIREIRKSKGYSIEELSFRSSITSKTVQRIETNQTNPRGHTLQKIAKALEVPLERLTVSSQIEVSDENQSTDIIALKKLNLSALLIFLIPLSNLIFTIYYYQKFKQHTLIRDIGAKIVSFHILWFIVTSLFLIAAPFIKVYAHVKELTIFGSLLFTYLFFWLINIAVSIKIATELSRNRFMLFNKFPNLL